MIVCLRVAQKAKSSYDDLLAAASVVVNCPQLTTQRLKHDCSGGKAQAQAPRTPYGDCGELIGSPGLGMIRYLCTWPTLIFNAIKLRPLQITTHRSSSDLRRPAVCSLTSLALRRTSWLSSLLLPSLHFSAPDAGSPTSRTEAKPSDHT